jgi:hypothetical protein
VKHLRGIAGVFAVAIAVLLQCATLAQEQLTEVERLRWELANTREQLHAAMIERDACRAQITPIRGDVLNAERAKLKADIELAHECATKGCTFDTHTGRLTKKPETPKER